MSTESIKNQFNPDYLCDDPSCKSREITMEILKERDEVIDKMERDHKAEIMRMKEEIKSNTDCCDNHTVIRYAHSRDAEMARLKQEIEASDNASLTRRSPPSEIFANSERRWRLHKLISDCNYENYKAESMGTRLKEADKMERDHKAEIKRLKENLFFAELEVDKSKEMRAIKEQLLEIREKRLKDADKIVELALDFSDRLYPSKAYEVLCPDKQNDLEIAILDYQEKWNVKPTN